MGPRLRSSIPNPEQRGPGCVRLLAPVSRPREPLGARAMRRAQHSPHLDAVPRLCLAAAPTQGVTPAADSSINNIFSKGDALLYLK